MKRGSQTAPTPSRSLSILRRYLKRTTKKSQSQERQFQEPQGQFRHSTNRPDHPDSPYKTEPTIRPIQPREIETEMGLSLVRTPTPSLRTPDPPSSADSDADADADRTVVFTYGTLKRGFSNHNLIQDLIRSGDASFAGPARTAGRLPLVCGPYRVPFLLNLPGLGERVSGELYAVSARGIARMDELEGTRRGHYERLPIAVVRDDDGAGDRAEEEASVEAYYAHRSYAAELWRRSGERGLGQYSEKEAVGYVRRKDRPQDLTFLDQIRIFVASQN